MEALLAAQASGCADTILASLAKSYPGLGFPDLAGYQFERTLKHGRRRAAEMRESAATLADLGLNGRLAEAIADVQAAMGDIGAMVDSRQPLATLLAEALTARLSGGSAAG